jgi:hypothetical protein
MSLAALNLTNNRSRALASTALIPEIDIRKRLADGIADDEASVSSTDQGGGKRRGRLHPGRVTSQSARAARTPPGPRRGLQPRARERQIAEEIEHTRRVGCSKAPAGNRAYGRFWPIAALSKFAVAGRGWGRNIFQISVPCPLAGCREHKGYVATQFATERRGKGGDGNG